jgi:hypothetical protein
MCYKVGEGGDTILNSWLSSITGFVKDVVVVVIGETKRHWRLFAHFTKRLRENGDTASPNDESEWRSCRRNLLLVIRGGEKAASYEFPANTRPEITG